MSLDSPQPSLFVPHGAPTFMLHPGAAGAALSALADTLPMPRAIVMVSAHWETAVPTVGFAPRPETMYDFWGFPEALYRLHYPATGCPEAAAEVQAALQAAGFPVETDAGRGLDHGTWMPLKLLFPNADVPVIPLSIQPAAGPGHHLRLGRALLPLTQRGFLVIGSGNLTHNLRDYQQAARHGGATPDYVRAFADWMHQQLLTGDVSALLDYRRQAPGAVQAHPRDEHLLPLYVAFGAAGAGAQTRRFHAGIDDYVLAMDGFVFSNPEHAQP
ncbi:MAG TPA: class III extradiol ring-cleavage dioxygenase [Candidatus Competibacteraceae bacterium]|nr:MAG: dioxygenase [Candidatus Competibacteraceae bacterium]HNW78947.1 class III extradiol ring-cleavage dioxygenase [Candidatus Competibacteraceae bacterium]HQC72849.1 class III extradiol ring-cleavage dioxygenase [Candidatus Competibacteraceae bacterium]